MRHSFSFVTKLWISLGILIISYFVSMGVGFILGQRTETRLHNVSEYIFPAAEQSRLALTTFEKQIEQYNTAIMLGEESAIEAAKASSEETVTALESIADLAGLETHRKDEVRKVFQEIIAFTDSAQPLYLEMSRGSENDEIYEKAFLLAQKTEDLRAKLTRFTTMFSDDLDGELSGVIHMTRSHRYFNMIIFFGIVFCTLIGVWLIISRSVTRPLRGIISGLQQSSDQVAFVSHQILRASQFLAKGASEQTTSSEAAASSLEAMSSMTRKNADHANEADHLMKTAKQIVETANHAMADLTTSMADISKASEETYNIIKTIDGIAFQTNLLALNAAVEAARAGVAGAGFAVVADEVRNLALGVADAAKDTASLIEGVVNKIKDGSEIVARTNHTFSEIADISVKVGELVGEIAAASDAQARGIGTVNERASRMDKITRQNAANAQKTSSAAEEMNAQAERMKEFVAELTRLVGRMKDEV